MKRNLLIACFIIAITATSLYLYNDYPAPSFQTISKSTSPENNQTPAMEIVATNLDVPWALAFLPNGSILVTERKGSIKLIDKNRKISQVGEIKVHQNGESGMHGVAIHPNFNKNHFVYFYYTYTSSGQESQNKVVRFVFKDNGLTDPFVIVDKIPGAIFHDGGRIKFGPDGYLYITTGDALNPSLAQNKNSLAGKILRVTDDGKSAPKNPFNNLIYSYGHRNPQGIAWDTSGQLWETEHGNSATDEINFIEVGANYGWPTIRGDQKKIGMQNPKIQSGNITWAPAGAAFYKNSLFFGGLRSTTLFQLNINTLELKIHFEQEFGRIREVVLGPDNLLYITTSNRDGRGTASPDDDKIIQINPEELN